MNGSSQNKSFKYMWSFKSNIPFVESIFTEEDGELITIIHEKGAHKFRREEIIELTLKADQFSVHQSVISQGKTIRWWHRVGFSFGVLYISFLLLGGFINAFIPLFFEEFRTYGEFWAFCLKAGIISLPLSIFSYIYLNWIRKYFLIKKDIHYLSKDVLRVKLNNIFVEVRLNQNYLWCLYNWINRTQEELKFIKDKSPEVSIHEVRTNKQYYKLYNFLGFCCLALVGVAYYDFPFWFYSAVNLFANDTEAKFAPLFFGINDLFVPDNSLHYFTYFKTDYTFIQMFYHGVISNVVLLPFLILCLFFVWFVLIYSLTAILWPAIYFYSKLKGDVRDIRKKIGIKSHLLALTSFSVILIFNNYVYQDNKSTLVFIGIVFFLYILSPILVAKSIISYAGDIIFILIVLFWFIFIASIIDADSLNRFETPLYDKFVPYFFIIPPVLMLFYLAPNFFRYKLKKTDSIYFRLYKNHKPSVKRWLEENPLLLKDLPKKWSESYEMVQTALRVNPDAFEYACQEIQSDQEFIKEEIMYVQDQYKYSSSGKITESDQKTIEILSGYLRG